MTFDREWSDQEGGDTALLDIHAMDEYDEDEEAWGDDLDEDWDDDEDDEDWDDDDWEEEDDEDDEDWDDDDDFDS